MASVTVLTAHSPSTLLAHAAAGFLEPLEATAERPFPSPDYLLVLRQGGVRDDLVAMAAERGVRGWFDPPIGIFHELPDALGSTELRPVGDFERIVLLSQVLRRNAQEVFALLRRPDEYIDAVDRLFGELVSEGVTADDLEAALANGETRDAFERRRDGELATSYREYLHALDQAGRRDGRDTWADCAAALSRDSQALADRLGHRREIRIFGLADLRGGWRILLRALAASPVIDRVAIYTSHSLDLTPDLEPELVPLDEPDSLACQLFESAPKRTGTAALITAPDVDRELGEVARRVRRLVDDGVSLDRIAVVSRQARPLTDLTVQTLSRFGVPATARLRTRYREIPVIRAVLSLLAAAAEGWTRHGLAEVAEQPFFAHELDAAVINFLGFRTKLEGLRSWSEAFAALEQEAERRQHSEAEGPAHSDTVAHELHGAQLSLFAAPPPPERAGSERRRRPDHAWTPHPAKVQAARRGFDAFCEHAHAMNEERPISGWLDWFAAFLSADPWGIERKIYAVPEERFELARLDLAGWHGLKQIIDEWREGVANWGGSDERLSVAQFDGRLRQLLACDVAHWSQTHYGVKVLEGLAAVYRAFDHVFIVGLAAGRFPVRAPRSPILDESDRERLIQAGLSLDRQVSWDQRERELFRSLVASARDLTLSYSKQDELGREVVQSAFIDAVREIATLDEVHLPASQIVTPEMPLYENDGALARARHAASIEVVRNTRAPGEAFGLPSAYNGLIEDPDLRKWLADTFGEGRTWSPTQIEDYAKCPWAYFSKRILRLERDEDPDEDMDNIVRGSVLHNALKRFYDAAKEHKGGEPVFLGQLDMSWAEPLLTESLDAAIHEAAEQTWIGHPILRATKREELRRVLLRFLQFEIEQNERTENKRTKNAFILRTGVVDHELEFDELDDVVLERNGVRFRFRGSIDRVERGIDDRADVHEYVAAVDYKTTTYAVPAGGDAAGWDDDVVLQVPLYAYALTQLKPGCKVSRVEYRAIKSREIPHSLQLVQIDRERKVIQQNADAQEKMKRALDAVVKHVRRIRSGEFPAAPAASCLCPSYCPAWAICRVKGGPRTKWTW